MLAQARRQPGDGRRRGRHADRAARQGQLALAGVVHRLPEVHAVEVRLGAQVFQAVDNRERDVVLAQQRQPLGIGLARHLAFDLVPDLDVVRLASGKGGEVGLRHQLRLTRQGKEAMPMRVGVGQQRQVAVLGAVGPACCARHRHIAHARHRRLKHVAPLVLQHVEGSHGLEHRDVHLLALPRALAVHQRQHDGVGRVYAADLVGDDGRNEARLAADHSLQLRQARRGLDDVVIGRPAGVQAVLAIASEVAVHQPRVGA